MFSELSTQVYFAIKSLNFTLKKGIDLVIVSRKIEQTNKNKAKIFLGSTVIVCRQNNRSLPCRYNIGQFLIVPA